MEGSGPARSECEGNHKTVDEKEVAMHIASESLRVSQEKFKSVV